MDNVDSTSWTESQTVIFCPCPQLPPWPRPPWLLTGSITVAEQLFYLPTPTPYKQFLNSSSGPTGIPWSDPCSPLWPHHLLPPSPSLTSLSCDPWRHQAYSYPKALTLAVFSTWSVLPQVFALLTQCCIWPSHGANRILGRWPSMAWKVISLRWLLWPPTCPLCPKVTLYFLIFVTTHHYLKASSWSICSLTCSLPVPLE